VTSSSGADGSQERRRRPTLIRRRDASNVKPPLGWWRAVAICVLLVALYFIAPLGQSDEPLPLGVSASLAALTICAMALLVTRRIQKQVEDPRLVDLPTLAVLFLSTVVAFAVVYFTLQRSSPGEVAGLHTRLDSLYFTLTMTTTVGFGDIHPAGQTARGIACMNLVFNAVFLGALIRTGSSQLARRHELQEAAKTSESKT
jgi:voltage-gated potassium channel